MAEQLKEVEAIANDPAAPTFDNTIVAMERSGQLLDRATTLFYNLVGADTNDARKKIQADYAAKMSAHQDAIQLDPKLFARIQSLYEQRSDLGLDAEGVRLVERYHDDFVRAGAKLSDADKVRLKEINGELATLATKFSQNVLAEVNDSAIVVDTREELDGLSDEAVAAAAEAAKTRKLDGKYVLALQNTTGQPPEAFLTNRALRQRLHEASIVRGSRGNAYDNTAIVSQIMKLRVERAKMLGYPTYAAYSLANQTAKTPEAVNSMLGKLAPPAVANARREAAELQAVIDSEQKAKGQPSFKLEPWDWAFYSEKVRQKKYAFDESQIKPYLEMKNVLENGVFYAAGQLYGLKFKQRTDLPVYQPDVLTYDVVQRGRLAAGDLHRRHVRASVQARRRLDECLRAAEHAVRHAAGGRQSPEHSQALGRQADPADLGRNAHDVPRVRPCAARHVLEREVPVLRRHQRAARLRRVPLAGQ